ncbi:MAG: 50S ribosomal protein L4 [Firmicutes bacterium]|nr:50S ribosomal protein L4 [Bacillota bacterium]
MIKIKVIDQQGKASGTVDVSPSVFGAERNDSLIHEVAIAQMNNQRQGTKSTLARQDVRGHAAKPYRQKGTGRARQGSTKSVHHVGGGVAFAPKPRDFTTKINKKKKFGAFVSAISAKLGDNELLVLKTMDLKEAKTKLVADILENIKLAGKRILFVTNGKDEQFLRSANNLPKVEITTAAQLSVMDIVNFKYIVASVDAIKAIDAQYKDEPIAEEKPVAKKTVAKEVTA